MANNTNGPTYVGRSCRGYNLHSGRHVEYGSPLVNRVPRSLARDVNAIFGKLANYAKNNARIIAVSLVPTSCISLCTTCPL